MEYEQKVTPNLNTQGQVGLCLKFIEDEFQTPHNPTGRANDCATDEWNASVYKHTDQNFPAGVAVPIWFSYSATIDGIYKNWGHVATRLPDGSFYCSPYQNGMPSAHFTDFNIFKQKYKADFVGWSEDLAGVRIVEEINMPTIATADIVDSLAHAYLNDGLSNNIGLNYYVGQPVENVIAAFNVADERASYLKSIEDLQTTITADQKTIANLNAQLNTASTTVTAAVKTAQVSAPVGTQASWFKKLLAALTGKK